MSKYCTICGKEKTKKYYSGFYDGDTGEKEYELICPSTFSCSHKKHLNVKKIWFGLLGFKCLDCGEKATHIIKVFDNE